LGIDAPADPIIPDASLQKVAERKNIPDRVPRQQANLRVVHARQRTGEIIGKPAAVLRMMRPPDEVVLLKQLRRFHLPQGMGRRRRRMSDICAHTPTRYSAGTVSVPIYVPSESSARARAAFTPMSARSLQI